MGAGLVVCFSRRIGSGKSSVTQTLANALRWPRASFGDYVRARVAERGGDPSSRKELQNLGQTLVEADPSGFAAAVPTGRGLQKGRRSSGRRHPARCHSRDDCEAGEPFSRVPDSPRRRRFARPRTP
jgi:hypothetical protein